MKYGSNPLLEDVEPFKEEELEELQEIESLESLKVNVLPQRKAFIDWMNNVFYKNQYDTLKDYNNDMIEEVQIYQYFIRQYY